MRLDISIYKMPPAAADISPFLISFFPTKPMACEVKESKAQTTQHGYVSYSSGFAMRGVQDKLSPKSDQHENYFSSQYQHIIKKRGYEN